MRCNLSITLTFNSLPTKKLLNAHARVPIHTSIIPGDLIRHAQHALVTSACKRPVRYKSGDPADAATLTRPSGQTIVWA